MTDLRNAMQELREASPTRSAKRPRTPQRTQRGRSTPDPAVRATFHLPKSLVDEAKNAVVALAGPPVRLTLAALVREALTRELARLRKAHHKGRPWPRRAAPLVGGRPVKS